MNYSIAAVQDLYKENIQVKTDSYDYQIKISEWQISHKTEKGYYIDLDFGVHNRGQVYVPAFKIDPFDEGYYLYLKKTDFFYYTSNHQEQQNKYIPADTLKKLDNKIGDLMNVAKELLMSEENNVAIEDIQNHLVENGLGKNTTYDDLIEKIESYKETRDLLNAEFEETLKEIESYKKIKYVSEQYRTEEKGNSPGL